MGRTVRELNENELNELRETLYWKLLDEGENIDEMDFSNNMLFEYFDGIDFVEDDFFCNQ